MTWEIHKMPVLYKNHWELTQCCTWEGQGVAEHIQASKCFITGSWKQSLICYRVLNSLHWCTALHSLGSQPQRALPDAAQPSGKATSLDKNRKKRGFWQTCLSLKTSVPRLVMVWRQMVPPFKKTSAPNLIPQSTPNPNLNLVCLYYFRQTSLWDGFQVFHHFPISAEDTCRAVCPSVLLHSTVLHCWACIELPLLLWLPQVPLPTPCPAQAVPAHLSSEQSVLCWLSLHSPPQLCHLLVSPSLSSPALLLALSSLSALPAILLCTTFCHLVLGPSWGEPTNLADYFPLLNNSPLSKILWLSNHFHWGAKQLLIQGASSGKVSSIKQWST